MSSGLDKDLCYKSPFGQWNSLHTFENSTAISTYNCTINVLQALIQIGSAISLVNIKENIQCNPTSNIQFDNFLKLILNSQQHLNNQQIHKIITHPTIKHLQPILLDKYSEAEFYMELNCAKEIVSNKMKFADFFYYENYKLHAKFETDCLLNYFGQENFNKIKHVAFIGSGPMPLSSIELLPYFPTGTIIVNYDLDENAIQLGKSIVQLQPALISKHIHFITKDVLDIDNLSADIVYLAALVGKNSVEKKRIISHLYSIMKPSSVLIARSSTGLYELLYQKLTKEYFEDFSDFKQFIPINENIINSIVIVRKKYNNSA